MLFLVVIVAVAPAMLFAIVLACKALQARTPRELRGDWWSDFEQEFRAYAGRTARRHRPHQS